MFFYSSKGLKEGRNGCQMSGMKTVDAMVVNYDFVYTKGHLARWVFGLVFIRCWPVCFGSRMERRVGYDTLAKPMRVRNTPARRRAQPNWQSTEGGCRASKASPNSGCV